MTLHERLVEEMKQAMKARDKLRVSAIRMVRSAIQDKEIEKQTELDDDGILEIIANQVKKRKEVIAQLQNSGRAALIAAESEQVRILEAFLPTQLSQAEITVLAEKVIKALGATSMRDMGKVIGKLIPAVRGKADNALVRQIVRKQLS